MPIFYPIRTQYSSSQIDNFLLILLKIKNFTKPWALADFAKNQILIHEAQKQVAIYKTCS